MSKREVVVEAKNLYKLFRVSTGIVGGVSRKTIMIPVTTTKGKFKFRFISKNREGKRVFFTRTPVTTTKVKFKYKFFSKDEEGKRVFFTKTEVDPTEPDYLKLRGDFVHAVDGVSFKIYKGETFGLVGESGCGKSTTGVLLLQLLERTAGGITFKGVETSEYTRKHLWLSTISSFGKFLIGRRKWSEVKETYKKYASQVRLFRKNIQIVFQNPYESLSPRFNVLDTIAEPLRLMNIVEDEGEIEKLVINELEEVGLTPGTDFLDRYPHELSGGQRQRVGVARAFILDPEFVVADEPVSMLDVSIRVGVLKIMRELTKRRGTGFLFITHDLALARHMCDRVAVMYLGRIVEQGPTEEVIQKPLHPYTKALIKAVPTADPDARRTEDLPIEGEVPSGIDIPVGCRFHPRCPYSTDECLSIDPALESAKADHLVACIRFKKINNL